MLPLEGKKKKKRGKTLLTPGEALRRVLHEREKKNH